MKTVTESCHLVVLNTGSESLGLLATSISPHLLCSTEATVKASYLYTSIISPQIEISGQIQNKPWSNASVPQGPGWRTVELILPHIYLLGESLVFLPPSTLLGVKHYRGVGVTQLISATALLCKLLQAPKFQGYSIYRKLLIVHFMNRVVTDSYKMDKKVNTIRQLCKVLILLKKTPRSLGIIYLGENHIFLV